MKVTESKGKASLKLSKSEWEAIGKKAGWKVAQNTNTAEQVWSEIKGIFGKLDENFNMRKYEQVLVWLPELTKKLGEFHTLVNELEDVERGSEDYPLGSDPTEPGSMSPPVI